MTKKDFVVLAKGAFTDKEANKQGGACPCGLHTQPVRIFLEKLLAPTASPSRLDCLYHLASYISNPKYKNQVTA